MELWLQGDVCVLALPLKPQNKQFNRSEIAKIEALVFKWRTIGFGKQCVWLHPFWITSLSHCPHLGYSFCLCRLQEQKCSSNTSCSLSPLALQPACSRPSWWTMSVSRSTAWRCCRKKARTSRHSTGRELHFTTWVTTTRHSTTWKRQDPASQQVWEGGTWLHIEFLCISFHKTKSLSDFIDFHRDGHNSLYP